jgi:Ca2+-binding RTX toxin-like protein
MRVRRLAVVAATAVLLGPVLPAHAAKVTVPTTYLSKGVRTKILNEYLPAECAGMNVTKLVVRGASNPVSGTSGPDLILGGPGADTLNGGNGNDCIVGGDNIDSFNGGAGTDVCIGGGGLELLFLGCETFYQ